MIHIDHHNLGRLAVADQSGGKPKGVPDGQRRVTSLTRRGEVEGSPVASAYHQLYWNKERTPRA